MTNEDRAELIGAFNAGLSGAYDPTDPTRPIARLKAAWEEASDLEREIFKSEILKVAQTETVP